MKSQKHNLGELKELKVKIELNVVDTVQKMCQQTGLKVEDIVVIALKRFISSHCDYLNAGPSEPPFTIK